MQSRKRDLQDEERQQKRRTLGNIRFIGELFKLKVGISEALAQFLACEYSELPSFVRGKACYAN